jgi:hypothetical protein
LIENALSRKSKILTFAEASGILNRNNSALSDFVTRVGLLRFD